MNTRTVMSALLLLMCLARGGEIVEQIRPNIRTAQGGLGCPDQAIKVNQDNKSQSITECSTKIYFSNIIRIFFCHIS